MPWLETVPIEQRARFVEDVRRGRMPLTQLCAHFGVSRKTGYKWLARFEAEGRRGLADSLPRFAPRPRPRRPPPGAGTDPPGFLVRTVMQ